MNTTDILHPDSSDTGFWEAYNNYVNQNYGEFNPNLVNPTSRFSANWDQMRNWFSAADNALNADYRDWANSTAWQAMNFSAQQAQLDRDFQQSSAREAMQFTADQNRINREFQLEMSNTAYQRAMADLKKSGLNPILAYTQGGASTPTGSAGAGVSASGSSASGVKASTENTRDILDAIVSIFGTTAKTIASLF